MYHVPLAFHSIYECNDDENVDGGNGNELSRGGENNGDYLGFCMQITWCYVASRKKT